MSSTATDTSAVLPIPGQTGAPAISERRVGDFSVDSVTNAPLKIDIKFAIKVPQEKAFELVLRDLASWFKEIGEITWDHERARGGTGEIDVQSTRVCGFGKDTLYEEIAFYNPPHAYGYRIDTDRSTAKFPISDHLGIFIVERGSDGESIVTWRTYFNGKGIAAPLITFMMKRQVIRKNLKRLIGQYGGRFL